VVLKELVDNALDAGAKVSLDATEDGYRVSDNGPGIDPAQIPQFFAVNRGLLSSKLKRLPLRGMLGNGLRVVMGAVAAYDGKIVVSSRGRRLELGVDTATGKTAIPSRMRCRSSTSACGWTTSGRSDSNPSRSTSISTRIMRLWSGHGATESETDFLATQRVELNAMTSRQLVDYVEEKLAERGVVKLVPDDEVLEEHGRRLIEQQMQKAAFEKIKTEVSAKAAAVDLPDDLADRVHAALLEDPELSWDQALAGVIHGTP
jgi:hypothetical protein